MATKFNLAHFLLKQPFMICNREIVYNINPIKLVLCVYYNH